jgi:antitoxin YefM
VIESLDDRQHKDTLPSSGSALRSLDVMTGILVMSETLPLSSVKAHLSEPVDRVEGEHERVVVTRNGRPAAVLISHEDLEGLETLAALSDPEFMLQIRERSSARPPLSRLSVRSPPTRTDWASRCVLS